ncbi:bifunctional DNA primase/polymerase [Actinacidiphila yeochonensis]|uniref:bifunctional DNA primase/polymerase n=1 Tax=Actinacidiphila yeochonensis TaxID=89050 RepID=UPI00099BEA94|nr:bifunctional DNA primase/polymerase [Actinacidiphila yeochonensis]
MDDTERRQLTPYATTDGVAWLASASAFPRSVRALWSARPAAPSVLPCGTVFDVLNLPELFGRRVLEHLWSDGPCGGPGSGPAAVHQGRVLLLASVGTAQRLPALLEWEEWGRRVPPMLCHGAGDAVTVPPLPGPGRGAAAGRSRWLVAPASASPWLPGAEVLLWACVRAVRTDRTAARAESVRTDPVRTAAPVPPLVTVPGPA